VRNGQKQETMGHRLKTFLEGVGQKVGPGAYSIQARLNDDGSSFSGHERNHLFLNQHGRQFYDVSGVAGLDSPADARSMALWDYDRDGWPDLAVVNANNPQLELYRNRIGESPGHLGPGKEMVAVRFVGGNRTSLPAPGWSTRDGYGAKVVLDLGDMKVERELHAGEGLGAQNSSTLIVGVGKLPLVTTLTVRWPSGRVEKTEKVPTGTLVTAFEDPAQSPDGSGFHREQYVRPSSGANPTATTAGATLLENRPGSESPATLRMYTTLATWCQACRKEIPLLIHLRESFRPEQLAIYGIPTDREDSPAKLNAWVSELRPPYEVLTGLTEDQVSSVERVILGELKLDAIPASVLTDSDGHVLYAQWGVPPISKVRELLARQGTRRR
jgi:thiol-disulfide isomerase/thioredoxin